MAFAMLKEMFVQSLKYRTVMLRLTRSDYYKLQMICEALNETVPAEHEVTPEIIGTRVMETFIRESFQDSTNRIVKHVIPEARKHRTAGEIRGR